jgi:hypothetical protein
MSMGGRLETLDVSALLQTLAVGHASGRLTLSRLTSHAVLVLRRGRVVYASGGVSPDTLAGRLLRGGLVAEPDLVTALERQHDGTGVRRLGEVLVDMGLLAEGTLDATVRRHMQDLVTELLGWKSGFFRFEPASEAREPSLEVDLGDFVLPAGVAPQELLMLAVAALDRRDQATIPPGPPPPGLREALAAGGPPAEPEATAKPAAKPPASPTGSFAADFTGEAVLSLLRFASQVLSRAVVFAVDGSEARGVGEFGVTTPGRPASEVVRETRLSLREPSVLRLALERRRSYVGPLEPTHANLQLAARLGGAEVREAVAIPLVVRGEVLFVLYGDNAPGARPVGPLDSLEAAAARTARIVEKTLDARDRPQRPTPAS